MAAVGEGSVTGTRSDNQKENPEGYCLPRGLLKADAFDIHMIVQTPGRDFGHMDIKSPSTIGKATQNRLRNYIRTDPRTRISSNSGAMKTSGIKRTWWSSFIFNELRDYLRSRRALSEMLIPLALN